MLHTGFGSEVLHSGHKIRLTYVKQFSHSSPHNRINASNSRSVSGHTVYSEHRGF